MIPRCEDRSSWPMSCVVEGMREVPVLGHDGGRPPPSARVPYRSLFPMYNKEGFPSLFVSLLGVAPSPCPILTDCRRRSCWMSARTGLGFTGRSPRRGPTARRPRRKATRITCWTTYRDGEEKKMCSIRLVHFVRKIILHETQAGAFQTYGRFSCCLCTEFYNHWSLL